MKKAFLITLTVFFLTRAVLATEQILEPGPEQSNEQKAHADDQGDSHAPAGFIPKPLDFYQDSTDSNILTILKNRIAKEPFNIVASIIFLLAIIHTFFSAKLTHIAHHFEKIHEEKMLIKAKDKREYIGESFDEVDFKANIFHFLGEVEAIFGLWALVLTGAVIYFYDWNTMVDYLSHRVNFTEPMFVVTIMALASSRPIIKFAEDSLRSIASLGKGTPAAWWFTILTIGPVLGSFITEPAAMTISALLLARQFYDLKPSSRFAYATIGLLFVNVSIGGTLTHFAAPPVLMVAQKWNWGFDFMFFNFGWKAMTGILINNILYITIFAREFRKLETKAEMEKHSAIPWDERQDPIPFWITVFHMLFMAWTVFNAHHPAIFVGGFLFYLGFATATIHHQNRLNMRGPLMVGFFLAGLVIHGGLQAWWLAPILGSLSEVPLMIGSTILTSFNDNAAITYLSSLVPNLSDTMKYAVMAGAVTGGGLTVIANAPNPAGQAILSEFFPDGVSPVGLLAGAIIPTIIVGITFMVL
jgi:hypothetical protein